MGRPHIWPLLLKSIYHGCPHTSVHSPPGRLSQPLHGSGGQESRSKELDFAPSPLHGEGQVPRLRLREDIWGIRKPRWSVCGFSSLLSHRHVPPRMQARPFAKPSVCRDSSDFIVISAIWNSSNRGGHLLCRAECTRHRVVSLTPCRETPTEPGMSGRRVGQ